MKAKPFVFQLCWLGIIDSTFIGLSLFNCSFYRSH